MLLIDGVIPKLMSKSPVFLIVRTVDTVIMLQVIVWVGLAILMELAIYAMSYAVTNNRPGRMQIETKNRRKPSQTTLIQSQTPELLVIR